jgi:hypothetical protein
MISKKCPTGKTLRLTRRTFVFYPGRRGDRARLLLLLEAGTDCVNGPLLVRELAGLELGVDQVAVDAQLKASAALGDELELLDLLFVGGQQLARQTDGLRFVVSHRAILEFHVHRFSSLSLLRFWGNLVR